MANTQGRYGDIAGAGEPGAPFATRGNGCHQLGAKAQGTCTLHLDRSARRRQLGFDHTGQPILVNQALMPPETSPYAFDPLRRNQKFDLPFTEAELEKVIRRMDVDGQINPGRLEFLAPQTSYGRAGEPRFER